MANILDRMHRDDLNVPPVMFAVTYLRCAGMMDTRNRKGHVETPVRRQKNQPIPLLLLCRTVQQTFRIMFAKQQKYIFLIEEFAKPSSLIRIIILEERANCWSDKAVLNVFRSQFLLVCPKDCFEVIQTTHNDAYPRNDEHNTALPLA